MYTIPQLSKATKFCHPTTLQWIDFKRWYCSSYQLLSTNIHFLFMLFSEVSNVQGRLMTDVDWFSRWKHFFYLLGFLDTLYRNLKLPYFNQSQYLNSWKNSLNQNPWSAGQTRPNHPRRSLTAIINFRENSYQRYKFPNWYEIYVLKFGMNQVFSFREIWNLGRVGGFSDVFVKFH